MKTASFFAALFILLIATVTASANHKPGKDQSHVPVTVCHNGRELTVDDNAYDAHIRHGDTEGPCPEASPVATPEPSVTPIATPEPTDEPTVTPEPTDEPIATPSPPAATPDVVPPPSVPVDPPVTPVSVPTTTGTGDNPSLPEQTVSGGGNQNAIPESGSVNITSLPSTGSSGPPIELRTP